MVAIFPELCKHSILVAEVLDSPDMMDNLDGRRRSTPSENGRKASGAYPVEA